MIDIPAARAELLAIADQLDAIGVPVADDVRRIVREKLFRSAPVRKMRARSNSVTPSVRAQIIHLAETTELHTAEIAAEVGVNPGRVSEVLNDR